ncbi:hypothetical protein OHS70_05545 [Streptomyces sp. NBC_00390]|uniref:hypothetical protein n=1 Tax=Streptomyces sp. NBC_00390 TaxID=2975736 RepID=UPI002E1BF780
MRVSNPGCYDSADPRRQRVWRAAIGCVEHDTPVLSGAPRDKLLLGTTDAGDDALREVLETTRLEGLVAARIATAVVIAGTG